MVLQKDQKRPKSADSSEFITPSCMAHINILSYLPHADQADGTISHHPLSPTSSPSNALSCACCRATWFADCSWWREGQGRIDDVISSALLSLWSWDTCKKLREPAFTRLVLTYCLKSLFSASLVKLILGGELAAGSECSRYIVVMMYPVADYSLKSLVPFKTPVE